MPIARSTRRTVLDPSLTHIILTAAGPRHDSLLHSLTGVVARGRGNVVESRAMTVGGDITLSMLIEVEPGPAAAELRAALADHQRSLGGVQLIARTTTPAAGAAPLLRRVQLVAPDAPGVMHSVTAFLAHHGLDVVELSCEQRDATLAGTPIRLFVMELGVVGQWPDTLAFRDGLAQLRAQHGVALNTRTDD